MEKLNLILQQIFKLDNQKVLQNLGMNDIGDWDSLTHMDLIVSIENEFNIQIDGDDIAEMITFDAIRAIVNKYIQ